MDLCNPALWEVLYEVSVEIQNVGKIKGGYVSQLYIEFPSTLLISPPKVLRGFEKYFWNLANQQNIFQYFTSRFEYMGF